MSDLIPIPSTEQFESVSVSTSQVDSVVPLTLGPRRKTSDEVRQMSNVKAKMNLFLCLVIFGVFSGGGGDLIYDKECTVYSV